MIKKTKNLENYVKDNHRVMSIIRMNAEPCKMSSSFIEETKDKALLNCSLDINLDSDEYVNAIKNTEYYYLAQARLNFAADIHLYTDLFVNIFQKDDDGGFSTLTQLRERYLTEDLHKFLRSFSRPSYIYNKHSIFLLVTEKFSDLDELNKLETLWMKQNCLIKT
jgi:hypothetical protein